MGRLFLSLLVLLVVQAGEASAAARGDESAPPESPLIVAVQYEQTFALKDKEGKWTGPIVDFWDLIAHELKRPYRLKEMSLNDIMLALREGTIDVAITPTFITVDRERLFDFSTPLGEGSHAVVTPYEMSHEHPWIETLSIFFSLGTLTMILALVTALVLLGSAVWLMERKDNPQNFSRRFHKGFGAGIYWAGSTLISGLCFGIYLKTTKGRILGLMWMIVCGLALSALIASLSHSLTDQAQEMQVIDNDQVRYMHLGLKKGSFQEGAIREMGGYYTLFDTDEEALGSLLAGRIDGYLCFDTRAYYYANHEFKGKISVYPTRLKPALYAMAMPKQSPLRRPLNVAILKLLDRGLWESLLDRYGLETGSKQNPYPSPENRR